VDPDAAAGRRERERTGAAGDPRADDRHVDTAVEPWRIRRRRRLPEPERFHGSTVVSRIRTVRIVYRDAALADGRSSSLERAMSVLVEDGCIVWIRPTDSEEDPGEAEMVDAGGATIVPGMIDCHSHLTLPGGSHWIARGGDSPEQLLQHAEHNAKLQTNAGVRWARDVGAPVGVDPVDGRKRALSLGVRDRWRGHARYPYVRAAGTWVTRAGTLPSGLTAEAEDADDLLRLALEQLDDGADLIKLYLDGPRRASTASSTDSRSTRTVHA
jgi:hypothetical protein